MNAKEARNITDTYAKKKIEEVLESIESQARLGLNVTVIKFSDVDAMDIRSRLLELGYSVTPHTFDNKTYLTIEW